MVQGKGLTIAPNIYRNSPNWGLYRRSILATGKKNHSQFRRARSTNPSGTEFAPTTTDMSNLKYKKIKSSLESRNFCSVTN